MSFGHFHADEGQGLEKRCQFQCGAVRLLRALPRGPLRSAGHGVNAGLGLAAGAKLPAAGWAVPAASREFIAPGGLHRRSLGSTGALKASGRRGAQGGSRGRAGRAEQAQAGLAAAAAFRGRVPSWAEARPAPPRGSRVRGPREELKRTVGCWKTEKREKGKALALTFKKDN